MSEGTPEAVAYRLMELILARDPAPPTGKEALLALYAECAATVRGPVAEDLLHALNLDE